MALVPFAQFGPDRSTFDAQFCDVVQNAMPIQGGYGPFPAFTPFSQPMPDGPPMGSFNAYVINGAYRLFVGTQTKLWMFDIDTLGWLDKTRLGPSIAVNGAFDSDTGWTKGSGWTIAGGMALGAAVANGVNLSQAQTTTLDTAYKVTFTVSGYAAGAIRPIFYGGGASVYGPSITANGTFTADMVSTGNTTFGFQAVGASTTVNIDNVSLQAVSNYNGAAGIKWSMCQWGEMLIATNGADPPQYIDINTAERFADMPNAPKALSVAAVGDFVFMAHLASNQRTVQWSGLNQPFFWTPRERSSDFQPFPDGGEIMGTASGPEGVVIFHAESIREGALALETPLVFNFKQTVPNHGCLAPKSIVATGNGIFYFSDDGFYKYGKPPTPIGVERVDKWFQENIQNSDIYDIYGAEDPNRKIVYWAFRSIDNPVVGTYDKILIYHYGIDQWTLLVPGILMHGLVEGTTPGYTLDGLNILGLSIDELPFSLDSRAWTGSTPLIAGFDSNWRLGIFGGEPMPAKIQTVDSQLVDGQRSSINGFRPLIDAVNVSGRTATKETPGDPHRWRTDTQINRTGMVPQITSGMFHRFEISIPSQRWTATHGVYPIDPIPDGDQ